jgi:hypothetical protein
MEHLPELYPYCFHLSPSPNSKEEQAGGNMALAMLGQPLALAFESTPQDPLSLQEWSSSTRVGYSWNIPFYHRQISNK